MLTTAPHRPQRSLDLCFQDLEMIILPPLKSRLTKSENPMDRLMSEGISILFFLSLETVLVMMPTRFCTFKDN